MSCNDVRCTDGVTMCRGCNGYGVTRHSGKPFTLRGKGKYITENSPRHEPCNGTGLTVCGCQPVDAATLASITGRPVAVPA